MQSYIITLEQKIKNKQLKQILFNKYYNILDIYWNIFYVFWFSVLAGVGNTLTNPSLQLFIEGATNNILPSIILNLFYARLINYLLTTNHPRLYPNSANAIVQVAFLIWHFQIGTSNPIQTMIPPIIVGFILTNYHVTKMLGNKKPAKK